MKTIISVVILVFLLANKASAETQSLINRFKEFNDSSRDEFSFYCGKSKYRLSKSFFKEPELFFKSGLDWRKLTILKINDIGVVFDGIGITNPIKHSEIPVSPDLQIWRYPHKKAKQYFRVKSSDVSQPYRSTIDFHSAQMSLTNQYQYEVYLELDVKEYMGSQSIPEDLLLPSYDVLLLEKRISFTKLDIDQLIGAKPTVLKSQRDIDRELQNSKQRLSSLEKELSAIKLKATKEKDERSKAIQKAVQHFSDPLTYIVMPETHTANRYCYVSD